MLNRSHIHPRPTQGAVLLEVVSPAVLGPTPFEAPFTNWTWQIIPPGGDTPGSPHEIVIRHADPELVRRLAQVILTPSRASSTSEEPLPDETVPAL